MAPPPRRSRAGTAACVASSIDLRSTAITRSHSSSVVSISVWRDSMPTLLCSTSSPPQRPTASATIASQSALWVTSAAKASAWPFSARMSPTVSSARSFCASTQSTRAPSRAMRIAVALPLPTPGPRAPAPVTIAILPASRSPIGVESSWVLIMLSVRRVRLWSGLVLFAYVTTHLANHSLGLVSLDAMEAGRVYFLALWRNPVVSLLLYASLVTHVALAFWALYQRRTLRMPLWEAAQLALGLAIPPLLVTHIVGTRIAWQVYGVEDAYSRVALTLWALAPDLGSRQVLIVSLAWVHAMIGLHSIVKLRAWYPRAAPWLLGVVVLVPVLAILGFVNGGRQAAALARDPAVRAQMLWHGRAPLTPAETATLVRVREGGFVGYTTLLPATATAADGRPPGDSHSGREQDVVVVFADLRRFTRLAEHRLPYDVVFFLNRYFEAVGGAIQRSCGVANQYTGDGVMALFGLDVGPEEGCRQALAAAGEMVRSVATLSEALVADLPEPLRLGIGIHTGPAVVGRMGYADAVYLTAVGDTVHVASRLAPLTQDYDRQLVSSAALARRAGVATEGLPRHELTLRNRAEPLAVLVVRSAVALAPSEPSRQSGEPPRAGS